MWKVRRGVQRKLRSAYYASICLFLIAALSDCASVVGGGVLLGAVAIGALTSRCYDYLDVTVLDERGRKTCAATVTATSGNNHLELGSCYYTPLTDGVWTLRATMPSTRDAVSVVPVEHAHDCTRHVQSVELTLKAEGPANSTQSGASETISPAAPTVSPPRSVAAPVGPAGLPSSLGE